MTLKNRPVSGVSSSFDVRRERILNLVRRLKPPLVLLWAPGGYGKTVVAGQIASLFEQTLWIEFDSQPATLSSILRVVSAAARSMSRCEEDDPRSIQPFDVEPEEELVRALSMLDGRQVCVVLDAVGVETEIVDLQRFSRKVSEATGFSGSVVVTARDLSVSKPVDSPYGTLVLGREHLVLSPGEATALAKAISAGIKTRRQVEDYLAIADGQVGLFSMLLRNPGIAEDVSIERTAGGTSVALVRCIRLMLDDILTNEQVRILRVASVIGEGKIRDLEDCLGADESVRGFAANLAEAFPLFRMSNDQLARFRVHDLVLEVFSSAPSDRERLANDTAVASAFAKLAFQGRLLRLFSILSKLGLNGALAESLAEHGESLLLQGEAIPLQGFLDAVAPYDKIRLPRLLLLEGRVKEGAGLYAEALSSMRLAGEIASTTGDISLEVDASLAQMMMLCGLGRVAEARNLALKASSQGWSTRSSASSTWLACWSLVPLADEIAARQLKGMCAELLADSENWQLYDELAYRALNVLGTVLLQSLGDAPAAVRVFRRLASETSSTFMCKLYGTGNLAEALTYMGRLAEARRLAQDAVKSCAKYRLSGFEACWTHTLGIIGAADGRFDESLRAFSSCLDLYSLCEPSYEHGAVLMTYSTTLRARGDLDEALEQSDRACHILDNFEWRLFRCQAHTERLASRLALGDEELVYREGLELRKEFEDTGYSFYLLRLDMVLAEIERRRGLVDQAASRIAEHAEHIRGEGSNWHMAMYTRAFPGLLGVFARALGPDGIPIHMLRMLLEPWASRSLEMARPVLDDAGWRRLVLRTLGKASGAAFLAAHEGPPVLKVRLFGGLSVEGPHGTVGDKAWGKRKARLLFAMLAMHRGRDLPRDVIFERLWPDMPADKAQSNFYVTWSYMKKALSPDGGPCPYLEHRGGVCRVVPEAVTTDLAEFFEAAEELRRARARGDQDTVVAAAERMAELHAGELLAGDLYEDWCAEMRERARHELSDAVLAGAEALAASGAPDRAVRLVRHALAFDPWREDLYQAALRYQIVAGQRSSAIETYMACRQKLAEDLGLDPSLETQRLYEQVLAMEDAGGTAVPRC